MVLCEMLGLTGLGKAGSEGAELLLLIPLNHYTDLPTNNFLVNSYFLHLVTQLLPATSSFSVV